MILISSDFNYSGGVTDESHDLQAGSNWGWEDICTIAELKKMVTEPFANFTLIVRCQIWMEGEPKHEVYEGSAALQYPTVQAEAVARRNDRFKRLLDDALLADVTIEVEGESIMAHKSILAGKVAKNPYVVDK